MPTDKITPRRGCRVLLAEAGFLARHGLRQVLESAGHEVVAEARDGLEASRLAGTLRPDVAVIDLSIPVLGGLVAGILIRRMSPRTRLVAIGATADATYIAAVLDAGFTGFVERRRAAAQLARSIEIVRNGTLYIDPLEDPSRKGKLHSLAQRVKITVGKRVRRDTKKNPDAPPGPLPVTRES